MCSVSTGMHSAEYPSDCGRIVSSRREFRSLVVLLAACALLAAQTLLADLAGISTVLALKYEAICALILVAALFTYLRYRVYEPQFIWLFLTTMFLFGFVFLDLFGIYGFGKIRAFVVYQVSSDVEKRALLNLIIAVLAFSIGWVAYGLKPRTSASPETQRSPSKQWQIAGIVGAAVLVPLVLRHYYEVFQFVRTQGYLAYQARGGPTKGFGVYLAEGLMWFLFAVFLAGMPTKRRFLMVVAVVVVPLLMAKMLSGQRAFSMTMLLALYWYWHWAYSKKVRLLLILPAIWGLMVLLTYIAAYRQGREYDFHLLPDLLVLFVNSQGVSVTTLLVGVQHSAELPLRDFGIANVFADVMMQFGKLSSRVFGSVPATLSEDAATYGYSGYLVTEALSRDLLPTGRSLGTSYLLELYLIGREWAQFLGGAAFGWLFHLLYKSTEKGRSYLLLYLILLPQLFFLPRAGLFSPIALNFASLCVLAMFLAVHIGRRVRARALR